MRRQQRAALPSGPLASTGESHRGTRVTRLPDSSQTRPGWERNTRCCWHSCSSTEGGGGGAHSGYGIELMRCMNHFQHHHSLALLACGDTPQSLKCKFKAIWPRRTSRDHCSCLSTWVGERRTAACPAAQNRLPSLQLVDVHTCVLCDWPTVTAQQWRACMRVRLASPCARVCAPTHL